MAAEKVSKQTTRAAPQRQSKKPSPTAPRLATHQVDIQLALADPASATPEAILTLQRAYGNRFVQRLLAKSNSVQREPVGLAGGEVSSELQGRIEQARGGGQALDSNVGAHIGQALGADFSNVRVHTDSQSDTLNRSLSAKAFTLGSDIFFSQGAYNPGSSSGQALLAHELTHVVQQGAGRVNKAQTKLTVGPAGDKYEEEADEVARQVRRAPASPAPIARMLKSEIKRQENKVVQRRIMLDGVAANLSSLLQQANDATERVIIANWGWSKTEHNFVTSGEVSAQQKLAEAIASAKSRSVNVPALYSTSNLKFLTKAESRLPTLYFKSGENSGRIRQQHGSGPAVIAETNKTDYFFPGKGDVSKFGRAAKEAKQRNTAFNPTLSTYNATLTPTADYFHYEVTYKDNRQIKKVHPSGGQIDTDISGYDDTRIQSVYEAAIGYST